MRRFDRRSILKGLGGLFGLLAIPATKAIAQEGPRVPIHVDIPGQRWEVTRLIEKPEEVRFRHETITHPDGRSSWIFFLSNHAYERDNCDGCNWQWNAEKQTWEIKGKPGEVWKMILSIDAEADPRYLAGIKVGFREDEIRANMDEVFAKLETQNGVMMLNQLNQLRWHGINASDITTTTAFHSRSPTTPPARSDKWDRLIDEDVPLADGRTLRERIAAIRDMR